MDVIVFHVTFFIPQTMPCLKQSAFLIDGNDTRVFSAILVGEIFSSLTMHARYNVPAD